MTDSTRSKKAKFIAAFGSGLVIVPALALGANMAFSQAAPVEEGTTTTFATTTTQPALATTLPDILTQDEIAAACGPDAEALIAKEVDGSISSLEQAALEALRQACTEEGIELAGPPAPPVRTVVIAQSQSTSTEEAPLVVGGDHEDHDEEEDEDHEDEDEEKDEDHEDEDDEKDDDED